MELNKFWGLFTNDLSIDLGTANTLVYASGQGIVINEPSVVAVHTNAGGKRMEAMGCDAKRVLERSPDDTIAIRPLTEGGIADSTVADKMLRHFLRKARNKRLLRPVSSVVVCLPHGATQEERRAIRKSASDAGAHKVFLVEALISAAIGAGMSVGEARATMVLDIGAGTSAVAVISLNGIVCAQSIRTGGDCFDEAIIDYVRNQYNLLIDNATAKLIKHQIGTACPGHEVKKIEVVGRHLSAEASRSFKLDSNDVLNALQKPLAEITGAVKTALEATPRELALDVAERGIVLTGGGAMLANVNKFINKETGIPVAIADDPLTCVARGGGILLKIVGHKAGNMFVLD